ncbi:hypothetical protein XM38_017820 [Halomicronema hongdechloris C2206]|uniref:Polysaccharide chain length determinant N-terminal domain-containing protein n=1 Tax=Halomicronema hongdechloris C2206 TaxID=1641165 RepID=A0A1Z3HKM4_9CYAN|nr:hypothetical protein [Halomicronema hongdechloris]ASC70835.1 hypothetical protein XM38_017820 [Halomicronema hongdechloris C2206]
MSESSTTPAPQSDPDEISLVDILCFFGRTWKVIALTTVGLSALGVAWTATRPQTYQKHLTVAIAPRQQTIDELRLYAATGLSQAQVDAVATQALSDYRSEGVTTQVEHDTETGLAAVTLRSSQQPSPLENATPALLEALETQLAELLDYACEEVLAALDNRLERQRSIIQELETEIAQAPPLEANLESPQRTALEMQRARTLVELASLEYEQRYIETAQADLDNSVDDFFRVQVISESAVQASGQSLLQVVILAAIASIMISILVAIIVDQLPRLRKELNQAKRSP